MVKNMGKILYHPGNGGGKAKEEARSPASVFTAKKDLSETAGLDSKSIVFLSTLEKHGYPVAKAVESAEKKKASSLKAVLRAMPIENQEEAKAVLSALEEINVNVQGVDEKQLVYNKKDERKDFCLNAMIYETMMMIAMLGMDTVNPKNNILGIAGVFIGLALPLLGSSLISLLRLGNTQKEREKLGNRTEKQEEKPKTSEEA
jgi:hypothetical protein